MENGEWALVLYKCQWARPQTKPQLVVHALNPSLGRQRWVILDEIKSSLVYSVSSQPRDLVSNK